MIGYHRAAKLAQLVSYPLDDEAQGIVEESGLDHLGHCMLKNLNMSLLCAFVERWKPDTNTFHMPFGEMSILLHDVAFILGLSIEGKVCGVVEEEDESPLIHICEFFGKSEEELSLPFKEEVAAPYYKGGAVLVEAVWIYKYFTMFRPSVPTALGDGESRALAWGTLPRLEMDGTMLLSYRQQLDALTAESVRWLPYGGRPDRAHPRSLFYVCIRYMDIVEAIRVCADDSASHATAWPISSASQRPRLPS
ncbi:hypothetical protein RND81_12G056200 [Saponaria officinalis]|uniref:Aminotransferase-like plant mobile domain-containing protein n=1 Tax=Saponaria officinalis TaxID=3572 RepID=A0AAW1H5U6_SAPOF